MNESIVITDTSCLILLDNIGALDLLRTSYHQIVTTPQIAFEFKRSLPSWINIVTVRNDSLIAKYHLKVDLGEASAIALAQQIPNPLLIIDDLKGRRLASELNLKFTGTIGVLITARQQKRILSLRPFFDLVKTTNFRISPELLDRILADFND